MKTTARITALTLFTSLILTACGGDGDSSDTTTAGLSDTTTSVETERDIIAELDARDFKKEKFTILEVNTSPTLHINVPGDQMNGDLVNDALFNRDIWVESTYNVDIEYYQTNDIKVLQNSVLADESEYDFTIAKLMPNLSSQIAANTLADLKLADDLSLDEAWWSPLLHDSFQLGGKMYVTTGDISPAVYQAPMCMFLNLKVYEDLGIETDIYDLVTSGKWTIDELAALVADQNRDLNNDGKLTTQEDFFGLSCQPTTETSDAFLIGADYRFVEENDGNLTLNTGERLINLAEKIKGFVTNLPWSVDNGGMNACINVTFKQGNAIFLLHKLESAGVHLRDMEDDYLVLPVPKSDENQENYISNISGYVNCFFAIPKTADLDYSGFIAEAMARYSHKNIRPLTYELVYEAKTIRDDRTVDVLNTIFDSLYIDFGVINNFGGFNDMLRDVIFNDKEIGSGIATCQPLAEAKIEEYIEGWLGE